MKRQRSGADAIIFPDLVQDTKQKKKIANAKDSIKYKMTQAASQENRSFPADGHQPILNKVNKIEDKQKADGHNRSVPLNGQ